jgi:hypothetical protein
VINAEWFLFIIKRRFKMRFVPKGLTAGNLAIGVGIVLLAPIVLPVIGSIVKPVVKAAIKGGLVAYEGLRVAVAEAKESLEDLTAEARSEIAGEPAAEE